MGHTSPLGPVPSILPVMEAFPKSSLAVALISSLLLSKWARKKSIEECTCKADLSGKTVIITGGNTGIGKATAIELAKGNATVIIACRSVVQGSEAVKEIQKATGNQKVSCKELDLCSFESVRKFAETVNQTEDKLHVLINNAGVISSGGKRILTEDGCEKVMQTNYFGHFLLTELLTDLLKKSGSGRIVNTASIGYRWGSLDLKDLNSTDSYSGRVYYNSKLANVLLTTELSRRLEQTGVTVNVVNPGFTKTGYLREAPFFRGFILKILHMFYGKTPFEGAQTAVHVASSPRLEGVTGKYYSNCKQRKLKGQARDAEKAKKLFETSQYVVGTKI